MTSHPHNQELTPQDNKLLQRANLCMSKSQYNDAIALFQDLSRRFPKNSNFLFKLATCYFNEQEYLNALGNFVKAIEIDPNNAEYQAWFARCLAANNQNNLAIKAYKRALEIDPNNLSALFGISHIYLSRYQNQAGADYLLRAQSIQPSNLEINTNLAVATARLGNYEEALKLINKALRQSKNNPKLYKCLGDIHLMHGQISDALQAFHKSLSLDPGNVTVYYDIVTAKKIRNPNDETILKMQKALTRGMKSDQRQYLHFALGKAYHDCKQWDNAFNHFNKANMLVHSSYDKKLHSKQVSKLKSIFNQNYFTKQGSCITESGTPIFIVGMPRSGSTLIDQILSSHTNVESVGESMEIGEIVNELCTQNQKTTYPDRLSNITETQFIQSRNRYLSETKRETCDAQFIVDKMPFNFLYLGLIAHMFPNAKIIHSIRHPLDSCLSCYMTGFSMSEESWAHNLEYIGQYYLDYNDLMEHWRKVLPIPILDVKYEDLVFNLEKNIHRILDFCGLGWESGCLEFYNAKRSVTTASMTQVRQPIYTSAVDRWVPYAKHLQPLVTALGDVLKDHEAQLIEHGLKPNLKQGLLRRVSAYFQQ